MGKVNTEVHGPVEEFVTIGAAASASGLTAKAIRLYEGRGLLAEPIRTAAGYRLYAAADIERLRFIAAARSLGLHVNQVAEIIAAAQGGQRPCVTNRAILDRRIQEVDQLVAGLTDLRKSLAEARDSNHDTADGASVCAVIEHRCDSCCA